MYRQYENPAKVHEMLIQAQKELEAAKNSNEDNIDFIIDLANEVESLRERENFAWQDEEYDENY